MTISKLQQLAEDDLGCLVKEIVITVPSFFTNLQRKSMIDADTITGLDVLQILNEGSALAIHYAVEKQVSRKKRILILDISAETVDVSICMLEKGLCEVVATVGDTSLGGVDFDNKILE
ncbi:PREDICTED: putative heat shock 70 kDa protein 7 [Fragaria vesca subsp. vesca]|uniref:putative heat shock 70 kDa protein 7 n=1 Tax=Fragaria vesca subsp. vesca TaxID=101020 RepID=UPI0002C339B5|nr:PREDICTED: putative heat shock 70 kDa protein 7 [Fragaria vesca subsp. vesca]